ncbi:hypothetical protein V6N11_064967 [Hibiscus sabdariffa]|uniref:Uncharacterized protein n=1 Tax=Hibiscus sabdariffa TaxID=183260 RepID=A0ABR2SIF0_9ROSI
MVRAGEHVDIRALNWEVREVGLHSMLNSARAFHQPSLPFECRNPYTSRQCGSLLSQKVVILQVGLIWLAILGDDEYLRDGSQEHLVKVVLSDGPRSSLMFVVQVCKSMDLYYYVSPFVPLGFAFPTGWISWYPLQPVDVVATNKEISIYSKLEYCYSFGFHFSKDLGFVCFQLFKIAGDLSVGLAVSRIFFFVVWLSV